MFQRKKSAVSYLNSPLHQGTRKRGLYEKPTNAGQKAVRNGKNRVQADVRGARERFMRLESAAESRVAAGRDSMQKIQSNGD